MQNEKCKMIAPHFSFFIFHFSFFIDRSEMRKQKVGSDKVFKSRPYQLRPPRGGTTLEIGVNRLDGIPFE